MTNTNPTTATCPVCGHDMPAGTDTVHTDCAPFLPCTEPPSRHDPRQYTNEEVRLWRNVAILRARAEVLGMIAVGQVPADVRTFSELHDYCDANELGGLCDEGSEIAGLASPSDDDDACEFANAVQCAVDKWLRDGRPEGY